MAAKGKNTTAKSGTAKGGAKGRPASPRGGAKAAAAKGDLDRRWSILLFALGLAFLALAFIPGENGWAWVRDWILFGTFGVGGWLLGPLLLYWAVLISMEKPVFPAIIKGVLLLVALCGVALVFGGFAQMDLVDIRFGELLGALLENGRGAAFGNALEHHSLLSGGLLGLLLGASLLLLTGTVAARVLLLIVAVVAVMVFTGVTPADVVRFFYRVGDKIAGWMEKDDPMPEEEPAAAAEAPPQRGRTGQAAARQSAVMQPAPARRMTVVDVPLDHGVQGAPVAKGGAIALDHRDRRVDIDLGPEGPAAQPGMAEHVDGSIGPGGTFGVERKDAGGTGLGDDYVPLVPFDPYSPDLLPSSQPEESILLFGEDDPYASLGGSQSKLDLGALPADVEHIELQDDKLDSDPDFELFRRPAPLPDILGVPGMNGQPQGGVPEAEGATAQQQAEPAEPASPLERAVRTAAEEGFTRPAVPGAERPAVDADSAAGQAGDTPFVGGAQVRPDEGNTADSGMNAPQTAAPVQGAAAGQVAMAGEAAGRLAGDLEVAAMIAEAARKKDDETASPAAKTAQLYEGPPLACFDKPGQEATAGAQEEMERTAERLVAALDSFGVQTRIINISRGPSVTRYEVQPQQGVKISRITSLSDDIALNLAAQSIRMEAPIPGKPAVGIEVPNKVKSTVSIRSILESEKFVRSTAPLSIALGKDIAGEVVVADLAKMPHVLIAGSTGSGKSVCVNSIIMSFLYKSSPEDLRLLLIDPKIVELAEYNGIPHLLIPVVTEPKQAAKALGYAVSEMEKRYHLFAEHGVRDIASFNKLASRRAELDKLPYIAIVIDELADLMMAAGKDVETFICRIAQKARAAGMHLIVATQRPSVDVITGLIKSNIPSRIAFAVASQVDSRTILDGAGAEKLLGMGDMLFMPVGANKPVRVQGTYVKDKEISAVLDYLKQHAGAEYDDEVLAEMEKVVLTGAGKGASAEEEDSEEDGNLLRDPVFVNAVETALEQGQVSTSFLQRRLRLGYARAGRIVDQMERRGIVSPPEGSKPRQLLITRQQWQEMLMNAGE